MCAFGDESERSTEDEVSHCGGGQRATGECERLDSRCDVDGETGDVVASAFDLTGMESDADIDAEVVERGDASEGCPNRAAGAFKNGKDAVAG